MAIPHAKSGEVIDLRPVGEAQAPPLTSTLVKTDRLEIIRLAVPAGKELPRHQVAGEITVQCIEGVHAFATPLARVSCFLVRCLTGIRRYMFGYTEGHSLPTRICYAEKKPTRLGQNANAVSNQGDRSWGC